MSRTRFILKIFVVCFAAALYIFFLVFAIRGGQTGIDYLAFMDMGKRWISG